MKTPRLKRFNVVVLRRSKYSDLNSFVLDLTVDRYDAIEVAMNAVANAQVWHRWLAHFQA